MKTVLRSMLVGAAGLLATLGPPTGLLGIGFDALAQEPAAQDASPTKALDPAHTLYTCPMHPQVMQAEPGACPICGMALVPADAPPKAPPGGRAAPKPPRKILYWVAPMDPSYQSDKPGKSPMGMDLVPVYEEGGGSAVTIDPVVVQNMGVRVAIVQRQDLARRVRTVGTVEVAEDQLSVVNLRFSGWIEHLRVSETGVLVKRGDALFDVYSPELVSAQQEYLIAARTGPVDSPLAVSARRRLELLGVSGSIIDHLRRDGKLRAHLTIRAPRSGYVIHKSVVEGARVAAGEDIYRIADLSKVWVEAEVYEFDAPFVKLGAAARVSLSFAPGRARDGVVSYVYPTLNPRSRTLRVRIELSNEGLELKPGAFASVDIEAEKQSQVLVVPTEAVLHSGTRDLVFVALGRGRFEPREVTCGLTGTGNLTEIRQGLDEGERIVTSGQFLLDSESQLREAVQKMLDARLEAKRAQAPAPASQGSGSGSAASPEGGAHEDHADTYWTCSMHPQVVQDDPGTCPICGMDLVEKRR